MSDSTSDRGAIIATVPRCLSLKQVAGDIKFGWNLGSQFLRTWENGISDLRSLGMQGSHSGTLHEKENYHLTLINLRA